MQSGKTALGVLFFFPAQRARRLIGRKGGRKQCALVKLLIYIPEWHKREGKALFHSHLSAGRRCAVRRDRMRPNNSKLSEGFFFFWRLKSTISQQCYFHARAAQFAEGGEHQSCEASSKESAFARLIICFNAPLNYCFLLPLSS